ncbi:CHASE4 domain-containing protein [Vibrio sp. M60_M31a]
MGRGIPKIEIERDLAWIAKNSGDYLMDKHDFDFSVAITRGDQEVYLIKSGDAKTINYNDLKQPLLEMMAVSKQLNTEKKLTNGLFRIGQDVYHIVGGPFISEQNKQAREGTYLALGKRIDTGYLSELEKRLSTFRARFKQQRRWACQLQDALLAFRSGSCLPILETSRS